MIDRKEMLALELFEAGAIKFGEFKLKLHDEKPDAPLSPFYIDLRIIQSFPEIIKRVSFVMRIEMDNLGLKPDLASGIPDAAVPIATLIMHQTGIPMITLRKSKKTHGISTKIMGSFEKGEEVLVIDDLVTKADTKLEAIHALEENDLVVKDLLVLVDREQGGKEELADKGYNLHPIYPVTEMFEFYRQQGKISDQKHKQILECLRES